VECANTAVTNIVLDASGSSDPDANIALYSWRRGTRTGPEVGFDPKSEVEQSLGSQTYVLRVIDDLAQADEAVTHVTVADTIPPAVSCSVLTPLLTQTNHRLADVGLASEAVDQCEGTLPVVVNVFADEDDNGTGDGNTSPDAADIDRRDRAAARRAQGQRRRTGVIHRHRGDRRSGNRGFGCCTVGVPHPNSAAAVHPSNPWPRRARLLSRERRHAARRLLRRRRQAQAQGEREGRQIRPDRSPWGGRMGRATKVMRVREA
jgi:hypothetical protein